MSNIFYFYINREHYKAIPFMITEIFNINSQFFIGGIFYIRRLSCANENSIS